MKKKRNKRKKRKFNLKLKLLYREQRQARKEFLKLLKSYKIPEVL